jgi:hypothetical protein
VSIEFKKSLEQLTEADLDIVIDEPGTRPRSFCHLLLCDVCNDHVFLAFFARGSGSISLQDTQCTEIRFRPGSKTDYELLAVPFRSQVVADDDDDLTGITVFSVVPLSYQFELRYSHGGPVVEARIVPRPMRTNRRNGDAK